MEFALLRNRSRAWKDDGKPGKFHRKLDRGFFVGGECSLTSYEHQRRESYWRTREGRNFSRSGDAKSSIDDVSRWGIFSCRTVSYSNSCGPSRVGTSSSTKRLLQHGRSAPMLRLVFIGLLVALGLFGANHVLGWVFFVLFLAGQREWSVFVPSLPSNGVVNNINNKHIWFRSSISQLRTHFSSMHPLPSRAKDTILLLLYTPYIRSRSDWALIHTCCSSFSTSRLMLSLGAIVFV